MATGQATGLEKELRDQTKTATPGNACGLLVFFYFRLSQTTQLVGRWKVCLLSVLIVAALGRALLKNTR